MVKVERLEHNTTKKILPGRNNPLGAALTDEGVNFALFSQHAEEVFLLFFDDHYDSEPTDIIKLKYRKDNVWHVFVSGIKSGQLYGYKIKGDYESAKGLRFNKNKLLIDPYAKALTGKAVNEDNLLLGYDAESKEKDLVIDHRDNTKFVSKSIVIDDYFDWQNDVSPNIPSEKLIIYEAHVKGFTAHPSSGVKHKGTYLGFIQKIPYLKKLGINAVEFLPVHEFYVRDRLKSMGLTEYWGYNTIGFFAPESSYSTQSYIGCQVNEFKTLVRELHKAGIEVILDVVYNHTGEVDELGPTLCFRGIDNTAYYSLKGTVSEPKRFYVNDTGCGNTFNLEHPQCLRFVIESLRYWAEEMHIDSFCFDLATILARIKGKFSKDSIFFDAIKKDSVLSKVKLIAEPWDLRSYQVGNFPLNWSEWNGKFRDTLRRFIVGYPDQIRDLARRVTGSSDLYEDDQRYPHNSINFITCHDGFTLADLFTYNNKHNENNCEDNRDGSDQNYSWNCGIEGEADAPEIISLRKQMVKNAFCCLFFSLGTPMIHGGDEFMRTQKGNNNAYCQDNEISWINWEYVQKNSDILEFCKKLIVFRNSYTVFQRRTFLLGKDTDKDHVLDVTWFGENVNKPDWYNKELKILAYQLDGSECPSERRDYHLFFIFNGDNNSHKVFLPQYSGMKWYRVIDTCFRSGEDFVDPDKEVLLKENNYYISNPRSVVALIGKR